MTVISHGDLLVQAAGEYLSRGLRVIALTGKMPNGKVHRHGLHDHLAGGPESEADWDLVRAAFLHPDTTGVGILTSWPLVVVDIDGDEGAAQWYDIVKQQVEDMYPDTWVATTGRGLHLYFGNLEPTGTLKLGAKLDLKGEGGYVAAPPSLHPTGTYYRWLSPPDEKLPEAPEALQQLIAYHAAQKSRLLGAKEQRRAIPVTATFGGVTYSSTPSFDGVIKKLAEAEEGNRNHMLYWAAATIAEEGGTSDDFEALAEAALAVGLTREETRATIRSAGRLGE